MSSSNSSHVHDIMNDQVVYVRCAFSGRSRSIPKLYLYKALREDGFQAGDFAVVGVSNNADYDEEDLLEVEGAALKVVRVVEVVEVDTVDMSNEKFNVRWIVSRIDIEKYKTRQVKELEFTAEFTKLKAKSLRNQVVHALQGELGDGVVALIDKLK